MERQIENLSESLLKEQSYPRSKENHKMIEERGNDKCKLITLNVKNAFITPVWD